VRVWNGLISLISGSHSGKDPNSGPLGCDAPGSDEVGYKSFGGCKRPRLGL